MASSDQKSSSANTSDRDFGLRVDFVYEAADIYVEAISQLCEAEANIKKLFEHVATTCEDARHLKMPPMLLKNFLNYAVFCKGQF